MKTKVKQLKENDSAVLKLPRLCLKAGEWKKLFPVERFKYMIAIALNYCTNEETNPNSSTGFNMKINGYLITGELVCLVLDINRAHINKMLILFYEKLRNEMKLGMDEVKQHAHKNNRVQVPEFREILFQNLFERVPFNNDALVKLITGHKADKAYYDPQLARLKDRLHHYPYSSVIDYAGAQSPVMITRIEHDNKKI